MASAGILPGFAGIVVSDRYQNYFHPRWKHVAGNQVCLAYIVRDYEDCAESYPDAVWPVQAQRALRGMIHAWHAACEQGFPAIPVDALNPLEHEFRHAVLAGLASVPRVPGPKNNTKQKPGRELLEFCHQRRDDVLRFTADTSIWPTKSPRTASTSAATSTPPASTARTPWTSCTTSCSASPGDRPYGHPPRNTSRNPRYPLPRVNGLNVYTKISAGRWTYTVMAAVVPPRTW
jgi:hypothetical protein